MQLGFSDFMTGGCRGWQEICIKCCHRLCAGCQQTSRKIFLRLQVEQSWLKVYCLVKGPRQKKGRRIGVRYLFLGGTHDASPPEIPPSRRSLLPVWVPRPVFEKQLIYWELMWGHGEQLQLLHHWATKESIVLLWRLNTPLTGDRRVSITLQRVLTARKVGSLKLSKQAVLVHRELHEVWRMLQRFFSALS